MNIDLALQLALAFVGAYVFAFWFSLVVWAYRDVRSRTHDIFLQVLATLLVLLFNLPGLLLYFMLRPHETLAESYERSLEEETLLQEIEEFQGCPYCRQRVEPDYQLCPGCHARLKQPCPDCGRLLQLNWTACPYCGSERVPSSDGEPVPAEAEAV